MIPDFKPQWNARKGVRQLYDAYRAAAAWKQRSGA